MRWREGGREKKQEKQETRAGKTVSGVSLQSDNERLDSSLWAVAAMSPVEMETAGKEKEGEDWDEDMKSGNKLGGGVIEAWGRYEAVKEG